MESGVLTPDLNPSSRPVAGSSPDETRPGHPELPGSAFAPLFREPGAISTTCQPLVETESLIREKGGYIEDAQRLADEENP